MSQTTTTREKSQVIVPPVKWRVPGFMIVFTLIALLGFVLFAESGTVTTFRTATGGEAAELPNTAVPTVPALWVLTLLMAALAAYATMRAVRREDVGWWPPAAFGAAFVIAFLTWVGADGTIPLTSLLIGGLALSVPLVFGALSGVMCERSGVINIAIEGQLLAGAFLAAVVASVAGNPYVGVIAAPIAGALVGVLLVFFSVKYWVDQIIVGVVLNVLVLGLTTFFFSTVLSDNPGLNQRFRLPDLPVPLLSDIPIIGPVLFNQNILVYLMYAAIILLQVMLFRSRWGLRVRAVGEHPKAADTVGINVIRTRWVTPILGSALAGLGGAFFTVGSGLAFGRDMSAGNGFIALAAMILGRWNPLGAMAAALLFGLSRNLANMLSTMGGSGIPGEFLLMLPYVITIFAVAGFVGRVRAPAAENKPYVK
ncbi:ABC transporter permease [Georgenia sp. H159]|uniref:ABC transporter permease n=1 Tax=Georgenia sp. H159 TaxID=3076115 RepID=UPI002D76DAB3|nr:ABC transporter permease [Georgenia sp. H159]